MNLRSIDLNLLVVFDALMKKRNVTHAAAIIGLSQPAFSNALTRLRQRLGDELFVRTPGGMRPTPWALELSGPVSLALGEIENALDGGAFDPATSTHAFTIATQDYGTMVLIPPLLKRIRQEAPGVKVRIMSTSIHAGEFLDTQEADVALFSWADPPERFLSEPLIDEDWVCVMRADHALAGNPMTLAQYVEVKHLLVEPRGDSRGWIDEVLAESGQTRDIVVSMAQFAPTPRVLESTDLIMACPRRTGVLFAERKGLTMSECPVPPPPAMKSVDMIWHARLGSHPAQNWLRAIIRDVAAETEA